MNDPLRHNWWHNVVRHIQGPPLFSPTEAILTGLIVICGCGLVASLVVRVLVK